MAGLVRALLWTVVLVAPGGVLLAPWLVHREVQRRRLALPATPAE
ncbi:MAG TPA: hypothetical protein VM686_23395 [Polyangiaceae bacterium]|nr:hypothetical protein [Polyangiaceae bacterium]